jgi:hypothetical protein
LIGELKRRDEPVFRERGSQAARPGLGAESSRLGVNQEESHRAALGRAGGAGGRKGGCSVHCLVSTKAAKRREIDDGEQYSGAFAVCVGCERARLVQTSAQWGNRR